MADPIFARGLAALFVASSLAACLSAPTGLDCTDAPPGTVGCAPHSTDTGPSDRGLDLAPPDLAPPDLAPPDARPPDGAPPDADPPDAAQGPACAENPCPAPPIEAACLDGLSLTVGDPLCAPATCDAEDATCDPDMLACRGYLGCLLWCVLVEGADGCEARCADGEAAPGEAALLRFNTAAACIDDSGCEDGPRGTACQLDACEAEINACVGDIEQLWFVRSPQGDGPVRCDYPLDAGEDCAAAQRDCRRGVCVDADGPCMPNPCGERPAERCDGADVVYTAPPACVDEGGEAICTYAEERVPCVAPPSRCEGAALVDSGGARCVDDGSTATCAFDEAVTPCGGQATQVCESNTAVQRSAGDCGVVAGAPGCIAGAVRRIDCEGGSLCLDGACVDSACAPMCDARDIVGCTAQQVPIRVACDRTEYCDAAACRPIPDAHEMACRTADDTATCTRSGLTCRGNAAVPFCLLGDQARRARQTCWTTADCQRGLVCTRAGLCDLGSEGSACETADDCQPDSRCLRGACE